jgi:hypothetical protein
LALAMNTDASRLGNLSTSLSSASNTDGQLTAWSLSWHEAGADHTAGNERAYISNR